MKVWQRAKHAQARRWEPRRQALKYFALGIRYPLDSRNGFETLDVRDERAYAYTFGMSVPDFQAIRREVKKWFAMSRHQEELINTIQYGFDANDPLFADVPECGLAFGSWAYGKRRSIEVMIAFTASWPHRVLETWLEQFEGQIRKRGLEAVGEIAAQLEHVLGPRPIAVHGRHSDRFKRPTKAMRASRHNRSKRVPER